MTREEISEWNEEALTCDGFDDSIIGVGERIGLGPVVVYDVNKMINTLIERDGMTYEDAYEYFSFNISGAWMGEYTPIFVHKSEE